MLTVYSFDQHNLIFIPRHYENILIEGSLVVVLFLTEININIHFFQEKIFMLVIITSMSSFDHLKQTSAVFLVITEQRKLVMCSLEMVAVLCEKIIS